MTTPTLLRDAVIQPVMQLRTPSRHISAVLDAAAASAASSRSPLPSMISLPKQASAHIFGGNGNDDNDDDDAVIGNRRRLASVSAFAFQGTNAHAILETVVGESGGGGGGCSSASSSARRLLDERRCWQGC